jgi:hypothetical protein
MKAVILRSQQTGKNLYLIQNSNTDPSLLLRMTAWIGFSAACQDDGERDVGANRFLAHHGQPKGCQCSR